MKRTRSHTGIGPTIPHLGRPRACGESCRARPAHPHRASSWTLVPGSRHIILAAFFVLLVSPVTVAAPLQAGGGFDYYDGPNHQITRSALAVVSAGLGPTCSASFAGIRYDDTIVGTGNAYVAGFGVGLATKANLRAWGTRYVGDKSFGAWRLKAGPQFNLPGGQSLGLYYMHYADNADGKSDGVSGELDMPLFASLSAQANASQAMAQGDQRSTQGSVGLRWNVVHQLELTGEMGLARGGAASGFVPSRGPLEQLLGGPPPNAPKQGPITHPLALVGVRVTIP